MKITVLLCLICSVTNAQKNAEKKRGMLSFGFNFSDYSFVKTARDSSLSAAFNLKGKFKSGNSSYGIGVSYWKGLGSHIDFSGNLAASLSNFPALFVKGDSIGQAGFTPQLDALLHARAFKDHSTINPFLTAGIGAGYFGKQLAVYAPVGAGVQAHFKNGAFIFLQAQWKMALTKGINNDYMFYSLGFAQQAKVKSSKVQKQKAVLPVKDSVKKETAKNAVDTDSDEDGVPDLRDECPAEKGTLRGCPDNDGDGIPDKDDQCKDVPGSARYKGCPVPDSDGDGLNDDDDKCPNEPGDKENYGCPADTDGDGIADKDDKCPEIAGSAANKGCPIPVVEGAKLLRTSRDSMTYYIRFDFDRAQITTEAFGILRQVVELLKADKSLQVNIEGHADNIGIEKYNLQISAERAHTTRDYFISYGIAKNRIQATYYGSARPYDVNQDWLNRRVEITLYISR